jgi:IMP dehydrogenase
MTALSYDDIALVPRFNNIPSRKKVDTSVQLGDLKLEIPLMSSNMDTITGVSMARAMYDLGGIGCLHRFCSIEDNVSMYREAVDGTVGDGDVLGPFYCGDKHTIVSLGVNEGLDRFNILYEAGARYFCVDIAHGHSKAVGDMIKAMRASLRDVFIIAGNVCTPEGAEYLAEVGADAIKVGIGPGSACTTRIQTGFGVPQFSAIQRCSHVECFIIADGGIRTSGDVVKAFVAGADAVMLGGMLAGTNETPGEVLGGIPEGFNFSSRHLHKFEDPHKVFRGMASKEAQDDFMGSQASWKTAEGVEMRVEAKGPVEDVVQNIMGGVRSGMTYCGANSIAQIRTRGRWEQITGAGVAEGRPHGQGRL